MTTGSFFLYLNFTMLLCFGYFNQSSKPRIVNCNTLSLAFKNNEMCSLALETPTKVLLTRRITNNFGYQQKQQDLANSCC